MSIWQRIAHSLFLLFFPLYGVFVFTGLQSGWAYFPYDEWRLFQLPFYVMACCAFVLEPVVFVPQKESARRICVIYALALVTLFSFSFAYAGEKERYLADVCTYFLLFYTIFRFAQTIRQRAYGAEFAFMILALAPLFTVLWLPVSVVFLLYNEPVADWHGAFANIRYYDDMLLPCLFLLWHQPGWLKGKNKLVCAITTLYALTLWLDGARAVLLSVFMGLVVAYFFHERLRQRLKSPVYGLLGGLLLHWFLTGLLDHPSHSVLRPTSSGRTDIWLAMLQFWKNSPVVGIGGDPASLYAGYAAYPLTMHPHNIVLQWLVEWGAAGGLVIMGLAWMGYWLWRQRRRIPFFVFAALIALCVNSLLSGGFVYPHTQIAYAGVLGWALSFLAPTQVPQMPAQRERRWRLAIAAVGILGLCGLLSVHWPDYAQVGGSGVLKTERVNPRFWQYGDSLHLHRSAFE